MLSNARVYVFNVSYQNCTWLTSDLTDKLAQILTLQLTTGIQDFTFKNLKFINVLDSKGYSTQVHINKITYHKQRIFSKEQIAELRTKVRAQLKKIIKFQEVLVVNDEFDFTLTPAYIGV